MRAIKDICKDIRGDWKKISPHALPYLEAMETLNKVEDKYVADDGTTIVLYFLANAASWRGETAKRIKAELKALLK